MTRFTDNCWKLELFTAISPWMPSYQYVALDSELVGYYAAIPILINSVAKMQPVEWFVML